MLIFTYFCSYQTLYNYFPNVQPTGVVPNWNSDAYFAKARVTYSAHYLTRIPSNGFIPFNVPLDRLPTTIFDAGVTLTSALASGNLYLIDHATNFPLDPSFFLPNKTTARPSALFYESAVSGVLKPVAIEIDKGGLVVVPSDGADWTLAKMIFNWAETNNIAADHFLEKHIALDPILTASLRHFPASHPLSTIIGQILRFSSANILAGIRILLTPKTGQWDINLGLNSHWAIARIRYL